MPARKSILPWQFAQLHLKRLAPSSLWVELRPKGRPCVNSKLLAELNRLPETIKELNFGKDPVAHLALHSRVPDIFSLGGDLALFQTLIESRDKAALSAYGHACIDIIYENSTGYGQNVLTYALVQGDALGGGMETALSSDYVVMEEQARMGLPEALFGLFPGMGGPTFLSRVLPHFNNVESVILSGKIFSAHELSEMGLCHVVAPVGEGEIALQKLIEAHNDKLNAHTMARRVREVVNPLDKSQLTEIVDIWVESALRLKPKDMRIIDRLLRFQSRK